MNVNLAVIRPIRDTVVRSVQDELVDHIATMKGAGFPVTGAVALVGEDQDELPGSYQVWLQITDDDPENPHENGAAWVWIDAEGVGHGRWLPVQA